MLKVDMNHCTGCGACGNVCPKSCIAMESGKGGFLYPKISREMCVDCGACDSVCGINSVREKNGEPDPIISCYGVYHNEETIVSRSSSGGAFFALANYVISNDGVVFGAAFDEDFQVHHIAVTTRDGIDALMGSKYVQSRTESSFQEAEDYLKRGRIVYYSGTPCQILGLRSYLRKDYPNLITQDVICHGVPSPEVWDRYQKKLTNNGKRRIVSVSFRDKSFGWEKYCMRVVFDDGSVYCRRHGSDPMMNAFIKNMCLRDACYSCVAKGKSGSDLTLGDFWGVKAVIPECSSDRGISAVLCHTERGAELLAECSGELVMREIPSEAALKSNRNYYVSPKKPEGYDAFMNEIREKDFRSTVNRYCGSSLPRRIIKKIKRVAGRKK